METNQKNNIEEKGKSQKELEKKNTGMAIVAYIVFFLPLLTEAKDDPFVRYHIRQGFLVFLGWAMNLVISIYFLRLILNILVLIFIIIGTLNAAQGIKKPLPLIGKLGEQLKI